MPKIQPNKIQNTLKRVSNREIKSLENIIPLKQLLKNHKQLLNPKQSSHQKQLLNQKKVIEKTPNYDEIKNRVINQLKKTL